MLNFKTYLPFTVCYSGSCGNTCDCVDSCPVETITAEMGINDLFSIGTGTGNEWIESIEQGGKRLKISDVLTAHLLETVHRANRHLTLQDIEKGKRLTDLVATLNRKLSPPERETLPPIKEYEIVISENGKHHSTVTRIEKRGLDNTLKRYRRAFPKTDGFVCEVYGIPYEARYKLDI